MLYDKLLKKLKVLIGEKGATGERFKSPNDFADKFNMKPAKIYETLSGARTPQAGEFLRWFELLGEPVYLKDDLGFLNEHFAPVPKVRATLCCGGGSFEVDDEITGWYAFKKEWLKHKRISKNAVLLEVTGESMMPTLNDGDMVMVDPDQQTILNGKIYAFGIDSTILVKRAERRPGMTIFHPDNPAYAKEEIMDDVNDSFRILGRVVWACRDF